MNHKIKYFGFTLIVCLVLIFSCQKRLFSNFTASGRLVDFFSLEPLVNQNVEIKFADNTSAKNSQEEAFSYSIKTTNNNGDFSFKEKKAKSDFYTLVIDKKIKMRFSLENNTKDFGDIKSGSHTFTCNLNIVGISSNTISIFNFPSISAITTTLVAGTNTFITGTITFNAETFKQANNSFPISIKTGSVSTTTFFPITNSDVINATLNY